MSEWQPIETAPIEKFDPKKWFSDHSPRLLLFVGAYSVIGSYGYTESGKGRWKSYGRIVQPSHWMPLPEPPK